MRTCDRSCWCQNVNIAIPFGIYRHLHSVSIDQRYHLYYYEYHNDSFYLLLRDQIKTNGLFVRCWTCAFHPLLGYDKNKTHHNNSSSAVGHMHRLDVQIYLMLLLLLIYIKKKDSMEILYNISLLLPEVFIKYLTQMPIVGEVHTSHVELEFNLI